MRRPSSGRTPPKITRTIAAGGASVQSVVRCRASAAPMHTFDLAVTVFGVIFVAELPDKTALTALVLATKYKAAPVFLGTALALAVQSAIAVVAGSLLSLLPARAVHIGAGAVFLVSAIVMWVREEE